MSLNLSNPFAGLVAGRSFDPSKLLGKIIDWCAILLALIAPLWFMPITLDVLELNKQTLVVIVTMVAVVAWVGKAVLERSFSLARSWLHLAVVCFLAGYLVTSLFSMDRYMSLVGNFGQMQWAFVTVAAFVLLYLVMVNRIKSAGQVYDLILWFLLGSALAGLYGLLQMGGFFTLANWPITASKTFNTVGTLNSLGVFMVIPTVIAASLTVLGCREQTCALAQGGKWAAFWHGVVWATLIIGLLTAAAVDFWVIWAGLLFGAALLVAVPFMRTRRFGAPVSLVVPTVMAALSILLLLFRTPLNFQIPSEVSPSAGHSWQIARQALRDAPIFGTGPGTWVYDYAKYRSANANLSQFWNIRFERSLTAFFTLLATLGIAGTTLWLLLAASGIAKSAAHLTREKNDDAWQAYLTVFAGWITAVFLAFLYNYNVAHHFAFWFLLALLGALVSRGEWRWDSGTRPALVSILSAVFIVLSVGAVSAAWLAGQRLAADAKFSEAVKSFQRGDGIRTPIALLDSAVALNKFNDAYYRNLSQAKLILASQIMASQPASQTGGQDTERARLVNENVAAAVDAAKQATSLSSANVDNWANLASIYQAITSFTRGADEFAIKNYREAQLREPNNPIFANEIGKLYVLRSDAYRTLLNSPDEKARKEAETNAKAELDKAAEAFNQSIAMKPDFAPAHFNLGMVYERQGRLKDAAAKLEQVLSVNNQDVGVAFELATVYYRLGDKEPARKLYEQIVQMQPTYANARWYLSVIYEERGMYDEAIAQIEEIKKTNAGIAAVEQRLAALKKTRDEKAKPQIQPLPEPLKEEISGPKGSNPVKAR